jgi:hypothetical protein
MMGFLDGEKKSSGQADEPCCSTQKREDAKFRKVCFGQIADKRQISP